MPEYNIRESFCTKGPRIRGKSNRFKKAKVRKNVSCDAVPHLTRLAAAGLVGSFQFAHNQAALAQVSAQKEALSYLRENYEQQRAMTATEINARQREYERRLQAMGLANNPYVIRNSFLSGLGQAQNTLRRIGEA